MEAYGSLASLSLYPGGPVDAIVRDIALDLNADEGQILLKWAHQVTHGGPVVTTSSKAERLRQHVKAFTEMKDLSEAQIKAIEEAGNTSPQPLRVSPFCDSVTAILTVKCVFDFVVAPPHESVGFTRKLIVSG